ncbi:hypothetical protein L228DRAFT_266991 [Xylona heveae TC161]|uniref:RhoGAP-domain-containing protein n=1 Tax=Xylona heveae (strain CBS 132557 / TC161) TaxID=1328760 RepID=A0A161TF98_XYLHT|nr:hypothetical protein L228DRAFT_266991 [Xylona heveae TC161]KZF24677.1 hypothetical protein L228DRAFT_266991 [Xylona heveae TC161]
MSRQGEGQLLYHPHPSSHPPSAPAWREDGGATTSTANSGFISNSSSTSRASPVSSSNLQRQAGPDPRSLQHKPIPSPLQTWESSISPENSPAQSPFNDTRRRRRSSPRTETTNLSSLPGTNSSGKSHGSEKGTHVLDPTPRVTANASTSTPHNDIPPAGATPSRSVNYASLRQLSNPLPTSRPTEGSSHSSPTMSPTGSKSPTELKPLPRTSSIDSAISSLSSHSHKQSQDPVSFKPADIANLIATAGSAEAVIQHLLKEKQSSASQNSQLWRLVDKQRTMILGLNKDLEQALKDKDRYRRKVKEYLAELSRPSNGASSKNYKDQPRDAPATEAISPEPVQHQNLVPSQSSNVRDIVSGNLRASTASAFDVLDEPRTNSSMPAHAELTTNTPLQSPRENDGVQVGAASNPPASTSGFNGGNDIKSPTGLSQSPSSRQQQAGAMSPNSFTAKRSLPSMHRHVGSPSQESIPSSLRGEHNEKIPHPQRKAPPAPLNLRKSSRSSPYSQQVGPEDHSGSEYDDVEEVDEIPAFERGRRKTREDDDRDRAAVALTEREHRSRSKREKAAKPVKASTQAPKDEKTGSKPQPSHKQSASDGFVAQIEQNPFAPSSSMHSAPRAVQTAERRFISLPPMSPGLPNSPRPVDRPMNSPMPRMPREGTSFSALVSPPMSPRQGFPGLPLSPRAPRQPIPLPPNTPMSLASPGLYREEGPWRQPPSSLSRQVKPALAVDSSVANTTPDLSTPRSATSQVIYRGLMSEQYPDLLVPPEALVAVDVRAASSRLRPSRHSYLGAKPAEEDQVFTLGVYSVPGAMELWRVEKTLMSLLQLDKQLKKWSDLKALVPDKNLFSGHAPSRIDARRTALDAYFHSIMRTAFDEPAALLLCTFLSTDAIDRHGEETTVIGETATDGPLSPLSPVRSLKEGYLTKKGKNFGGWKARYFCLEGPVLRYYETPGGAHLGTIKLHRAQIGRPSQLHPGSSPSLATDEGDGEYRHAFLILEPKRKDSASYVRHLLCAESDAERDEWVHTLLQYVDTANFNDGASRPSISQNDSGSLHTSDSKTSPLGKEDQAGKESPSIESSNTLRSLNYDDTVAAEAPVRGPSVVRSEDTSSTPSPTSSISQPGAVHQSSVHISGPTNGSVIQDVGAWGNLPAAPIAAKEKEYKKRSIWGFKGRSSTELGSQASLGNSVSGGSLSQQTHPDRSHPVRAVFGIPLAEAAEYCKPHNVDVNLPAVVYRCLEYLETEGAANEEGIFRVNGSNVVIKALRERFNTEGDVNFLAEEQYYDIHAVASLLKLYLRELPATVLTRELHLDFLHVLELDDKEQKVAAYNSLVHRLPSANWNLLKALSTFLLRITNNSDVNKMTVRNVGIVFSPTLNIPAPVFSMFLTEFDRIFGDEVDQSASPVIEITGAPSLTPDEIRSPRRQMFSDLPTPSYNQTAFSGHDRYYEHQGQDPRGVYDTGFVPMKQAYDQSLYGQSSFPQAPTGSQSLSGTEFGSLNEALAPSNTREAKARRRESTMIMMGMGQRKDSLPSLREDSALI